LTLTIGRHQMRRAFIGMGVTMALFAVFDSAVWPLL